MSLTEYIHPERNRDCTGAAETRNKHRMQPIFYRALGGGFAPNRHRKDMMMCCKRHFYHCRNC